MCGRLVVLPRRTLTTSQYPLNLWIIKSSGISNGASYVLRNTNGLFMSCKCTSLLSANCQGTFFQNTVFPTVVLWHEVRSLRSSKPLDNNASRTSVAFILLPDGIEKDIDLLKVGKELFSVSLVLSVFATPCLRQRPSCLSVDKAKFSKRRS